VKGALFACGVILLAAAGGAKYYRVHKELLEARQLVDKRWTEVDAALGSRADLVPDLVRAVEKHAARETTVSAALADARAALAGARTPRQKIAASGRLDDAEARLLLISENYPHLMPKGTFLMQDDLTETENRFLLARQKYNEALEHYNVMIQKFPANLVAGISGFPRDDAYFNTVPGSRDLTKGQY
jgi:LemA protein